MAKKKTRIKDKDRGYRAMVGRISEKGEPRVRVGVFGAEARQPYADGATVVEVAAWAELGVGQPRRSWLRDWFDPQREELRRKLRLLAVKVLLGKTTKEKALELLGLDSVGQIRKRITERLDPPNAPSTVEQKGSSTPLIDSAQFIQSITHEVRS